MSKREAAIKAFHEETTVGGKYKIALEYLGTDPDDHYTQFEGQVKNATEALELIVSSIGDGHCVHRR